MSAPTHLYGREHWDSLYDDLDDAVQSFIDDACEGQGAEVVEFCEWDVHPPQHHLPNVDRLLEWIAESADEVDEGAWLDYEKATEDPAVQVMAQALLDAVSSKVYWRQANQIVTRFKVTILWSATADGDSPSWTFEAVDP